MTQEARSARHVRAGRLGGLATFRKYGPGYMADIGRLGAQAFHRKYRLHPVGISRYAIVDRISGNIVNFLDGGYYP